MILKMQQKMAQNIFKDVTKSKSMDHIILQKCLCFVRSNPTKFFFSELENFVEPHDHDNLGCSKIVKLMKTYFHKT